MANDAAESFLKCLRDPAIVAGLGAVAVSTVYYLSSRPTPQPCPVDPRRQSYELPDGDHARMNSLTTELVESLFDDVTTIHEAFMRGVRISGDKPCLGYRSSPGGPYAWLTYNEVLERSFNTGSGLLEIGCQEGDIGHTFVGVYASNKIEYVLVEQACNLYSLSIIPLYDTLGAEASIYIINQAQMTTVVCDEGKLKVLLEEAEKCPKLKNVVKIGDEVTDEEKAAGDKVGVKIITFKDLEDLGKIHQKEKKPPKPDDIAVVCYTSGTTGNPKGVMMTHKNVTTILASLVYIIEKCGLGVSNSDIHMSYLPLADMYERLAQLMMFSFGGKVEFFGGNVKNILEDLQALKPTLFISVPRVLNRVYDKFMKEVSSNPMKSFFFIMAMRAKRAELERNIVRKDSIWDYLVFKKIQNSLGGRVRFLISGSAPLRDDVMVFLRCALGCQVFEGYGQTETTAAASLQLIGDQTFGHVGPPLPCNKIKLVDVPEMGYYAKDGKGEICVYGPNVFKGYLYNDEKTKETIDEDGWLHSGDIGEWLPSGTLKVIDRKKNIFKLSQGEYIAPEKIENIYTHCSMVHQVLVYGDSRKSNLVAVVVPEPDPVLKWADENSVQGDISSLCNEEKLIKAILDQMVAEGKKEKLKSFEQVKAISLTPEMWTVENNLLTPTQKLKRPILRSMFAKTFEELYGSKLTSGIHKIADTITKTAKKKSFGKEETCAIAEGVSDTDKVCHVHRLSRPENVVDEGEGSRKEGHEASVPNDTSDGYLVLREATDEEKEVELKVPQKIEALKRAHEGSRMNETVTINDNSEEESSENKGHIPRTRTDCHSYNPDKERQELEKTEKAFQEYAKQLKKDPGKREKRPSVVALSIRNFEDPDSGQKGI